MKTRRELIRGWFPSGESSKPVVCEEKKISSASMMQSPFFEFSGEMLYHEAMKNGIDPSCYSENELVSILTEKMNSERKE